MSMSATLPARRGTGSRRASTSTRGRAATGARSTSRSTPQPSAMDSRRSRRGVLKQKTDSRSVSSFAAPSVDVDLTAQTLKAPTFSAHAGSAQLSGSLAGDKIVDAPTISGAFKLEPLMLRQLARNSASIRQDPRRESAIEARRGHRFFICGKRRARFDKLDLQLDETQLRGALAVTNLDSKAITFDLNVDHIDLDRYLAAESVAPQPVAKVISKPTELPTAAVKALNVSGNFSIDTAKAAGLALSNVRLTLRAKDGGSNCLPDQGEPVRRGILGRYHLQRT